MEHNKNNLADMKSIACNKIQDIYPNLKSISHSIWSNPELHFKEIFAHKILTDYLSETRVKKLQKSYPLETAFVASEGSMENGGPHIAFLCEYDALPEIGHACGHNLIAMAGLGAFIGTLEALRKGNLKGKISVFGTPAEEEIGGKLSFIEKGLFKNVDIAMMVHPGPRNAFNLIHLSIKCFEIQFDCQDSSSTFNALDSAVMLYNATSCMRQTLDPSKRIHGIITNGGTSPYVVPNTTKLEYNIRATTLKDLNNLEKEFIKCIKMVADLTKSTYKLTQYSPTKYNVMHNYKLLDVYKRNAKCLGVLESIDSTNIHSGSTDMGNVSYEVASIHPEFYIGTEEQCHSRQFQVTSGLNEAFEATLKQCKILAMTAVDLFFDCGLIDDIKKEFALKKKISE